MDIPEEVIKWDTPNIIVSLKLLVISICRYDKSLRSLPRNYLVTETRSSFYVPIEGNAGTLQHTYQQFGVNLKVYVVIIIIMLILLSYLLFLIEVSDFMLNFFPLPSLYLVYMKGLEKMCH